MKENKENHKIQYPCTWHYRIIGFDKKTLHLAALETINKEFIHTPGKESSGGKYHSINIEIQVENQEERDLIFQALQKDPRVKFVL
ncbi:HP0495 family protein [Helicobacter winghamensis]|uniref:DUF493 domain-containing protein n=1 Tax=Helicobacter winghamensis TaxID=157268 RepID=A0A2N3PJK2_9HELI|nr:DUF493 domain-containing protein [Helicobacter winghamensis]EEO26174.1 hypothetical protein HWAG_00966 [Helicobacter winghamensis ATCC BAA-430]PKT77174.1 hypothetical protein BCM32_02155 [Helicobacter winghamensis]PKT77374.1 hypothetical protein BCM34_00210 [Helicobacter winghamensis]PKT77892.1 hypothetical protein BCM35_02790 [Helicobacter winghamensis]PKT81339.1 hypothetical protein BCM31_06625 [Helicobacter winghamensis]